MHVYRQKGRESRRDRHANNEADRSKDKDRKRQTDRKTKIEAGKCKKDRPPNVERGRQIERQR